MSGEDQQVPLVWVSGDFPEPEVPVVFCDGVSSASPTPSVVKVYFARIDPSIQADGTVENKVILQLIVPVPNFIQSVQFLENVIDSMIASKIVTQEDVVKYRSFANIKKP